MKITIKRYSRKMTYEDAATLDEFWELAKRTERSLDREQRRHWDGRECDEYIIAPYPSSWIGRNYTPFRCRAPCRGRCVLRTRWGAALPKPLAHPQERNPRFASVPFLRVRYRYCQIGTHAKNVNLTLLGFCRGSV